MNIVVMLMWLKETQQISLSDLPHVLEPDMWMCVEEIYGPEGFFS